MGKSLFASRERDLFECRKENVCLFNLFFFILLFNLYLHRTQNRFFLYTVIWLMQLVSIFYQSLLAYASEQHVLLIQSTIQGKNCTLQLELSLCYL